uniref:Phage gp6-like head-tail connector protein n=1 Tax=Siphoviridae sp. ctGuJ10 TaxID=2825418 RepID=A0A8S5PUZ2_9CAUD|nr:MAG TPA: hypothetical protein [Siphoviridae sp. ctGuJ10]
MEDKKLLNDVKQYISVDFDDDDSLISDEIEIAQIYIDQCCGEEYKTNEKKVRLSSLLLKAIVKFMYENRSIVITQNIKSNNIVTTIMDVLANGN